MKTALAICGALILTAVSFAQAENASFRLEVTRGGVTDNQAVYNYWSGEYPNPVIDLNNGIKGRTVVKGYTSLRAPTDKITCTVKNGIYHPWSRTGNSVLNYFTITAASEYVALKDVQTEDKEISIAAGSRIKDVVYQSEGFCSARLDNNGRDRNAYLFCDEVLDKSQFEQVMSSREMYEQWIQLACAEGHNVYVQDKDLLSQKGAKLGKVVDFGTVASVKKIVKKKKVTVKKPIIPQNFEVGF